MPHIEAYEALPSTVKKTYKGNKLHEVTCSYITDSNVMLTQMYGHSNLAG